MNRILTVAACALLTTLALPVIAAEHGDADDPPCFVVPEIGREFHDPTTCMVFGKALGLGPCLRDTPYLQAWRCAGRLPVSVDVCPQSDTSQECETYRGVEVHVRCIATADTPNEHQACIEALP